MDAMKNFLLPCAVSSCFLGPLAAQQVHVVDYLSRPGTDFTMLAPAVASAADGDILLVRPAPGFRLFASPEDVTIRGKSLRIEADASETSPGGPWPTYIRNLTISNLPAGGTVVVRGMTLVTPTSVAIEIANCQGSVWIEDCVTEDQDLNFSPTGVVTVADSISVVFDGCVLDVERSPTLGPPPALTILRSTLHVFDTEIRGRDGVETPGSTKGGSAVKLESGSLFVSGSSLTGGTGALGDFDCDPPNADGGDALVLSGTAPAAFVQDSVIQGGAGVFGGGCPSGARGLDIVAPVGAVTQLPGSARRLASRSPVRDDESTSITFTGSPGDNVYLFWSLRPAPGITSRFFVGSFLLGTPLHDAQPGTLDPSGSLTFPVRPHELGPGVEGLSVFAQALFVDPAGRRFLGSPTHVLLVDASF